MEANVDEVNILWNTVTAVGLHEERSCNYWRLVFTMWLGETYWKPARPPMEAVSMEILEIKIKLFSTAVAPVAIFNQIFQSKLKQSSSLWFNILSMSMMISRKSFRFTQILPLEKRLQCHELNELFKLYETVLHSTEAELVSRGKAGSVRSVRGKARTRRWETSCEGKQV